MATFQSPPPELVPVTTQTFFVGSTEHQIDSAGQSSTEKFTVDATNDFAVSAIVPSGYDQDGSLYELGMRNDRFQISFVTDTSGLKWQSKAYDIRHFIELLRAGRFPGMYLAKGAILEITISHRPTASGVTTVFPVIFECSLFGSKTNLKDNPEYQRWLRETQQQQRR